MSALLVMAMAVMILVLSARRLCLAVALLAVLAAILLLRFRRTFTTFVRTDFFIRHVLSHSNQTSKFAIALYPVSFNGAENQFHLRTSRLASFRYEPIIAQAGEGLGISVSVSSFYLKEEVKGLLIVLCNRMVQTHL